MKPVDIDKLFEKYLRNVMTKNVGKFTEDEWEAKMPGLYEKFGDAPLLELDGESPNAYFSRLSGKEVVDLLAEYVDRQIPVPDFLCDAITANADAEAPLLALVDPETEEELLSYCINLLEERDSTKAHATYLEALFSPHYSEEVKELMTEMLALHAEAISEEAVKRYDRAGEKEKGYLLDIIVGGKKSDRAYQILMDAYLAHPENIPLYVQYLVKYGDDRALPVLLKSIDRADIDYLSYQELRNAIEALGGEYDKKRDFSTDKFYREIIKSQQE